MNRLIHFTFALVFAVATCQISDGSQDPRVRVALTTETPITGLSTTPDGRMFFVYGRVDGTTGPLVVEYNREKNTTAPFPDTAWNSYTKDKDAATHFVRINSQRVGPDGNLWLVDAGSPGFGAPNILPGGPKVIVVNLATNSVQRVYPLHSVSSSLTFLNDIRFNRAFNVAFITDAGTDSPSVIVLDLTTGKATRTLDDHPSTRQYMPLSSEGKIVRINGQPLYVYNDQLEVSPDGAYLYYQPASGGMSRIPTGHLEDALHNSTLESSGVIGQYVEPFANTPSTGGTAIDAQGNLYVSDYDSLRVIKISKDGTMTLLVQDARLLGIDAMWIDSHGMLWMPGAQLSRGAAFNNGTSLVRRPIAVYKMYIGVGPSRIDHF
ncbi:hypothetical protein QQS21_006284 [Conoideocrella luteorostrata]|uniref:Major royal jelly protein n=1 Tax=Conoideocrella luteorostrata TaxID=1105319 RepID=A0AAJ0FTK0_9HYPO|nr:hypothetical protein QQS21_006284 [Conoideocrella luteorostrata]